LRQQANDLETTEHIMSVTFQIESLPTGAFTAECYNDGDPIVLGPVEGYDAILPLMDAHKATCEECDAYGIYSRAVCDVDDALDVNVSNMNARLLLGMLALDAEDDLCGSLDAADFLGRVLLAIAADRDDTGVASAVIGGSALGQSGATMIDCGLPAGYYAERFGALHALALEADRLGRTIVWS
jgi:hypothetical protein